MCSPTKKNWIPSKFEDEDEDTEMTEMTVGDSNDESKVLETVNITDDKGVIKEIIQYGNLGDETPPKDVEVFVHYVGRLAADGTKFDSSRDRNEVFTFTIGQKKVIRAWDLGVATMKRGERAIITCTAPYGYGDKGSEPKIPGGATLKFDVELFDWSFPKVTPDGFITKKEINEGEGWKKPNDFASVTVKYTGKIKDGPVFSPEQERTLTIGEEDDLPSGFMTVCKHLQMKGKAVFYIAPSEHHFEADKMPIEVTAADTLEYEIEMINFIRQKENWEMSVSEKIEFGRKHKERGNDLFKQSRLFDAEKRYERVSSTLENLEETATEDEKANAQKLQLTTWTNLAAVQLKEEKYSEASENCTKALAVDSENVKALFRRSTAYLHLGEFEKSLDDIKKALKINPDDKRLKYHQQKVKKTVYKHREKEQSMFRDVFKRNTLYKEPRRRRAVDGTGNANGSNSEVMRPGN